MLCQASLALLVYYIILCSSKRGLSWHYLRALLRECRAFCLPILIKAKKVIYVLSYIIYNQGPHHIQNWNQSGLLPLQQKLLLQQSLKRWTFIWILTRELRLLEERKLTHLRIYSLVLVRNLVSQKLSLERSQNPFSLVMIRLFQQNASRK